MLGYIVKVLLIAMGTALRAMDMLENTYHRIFKKGLYGIRGRTKHTRNGKRFDAEPGIGGVTDRTESDRPARIA